MKELSLHILDIVNNSTRAGAKLVSISIHEDEENDRLYINICDDGSGISDEDLTNICDPYFTTRTTRKVGMGIPLFRMSAEACDGIFSISSTLGEGTQVHAAYQLSHVDRPPLGDIAGILYLLSIGTHNCEFIYRHQNPNGMFEYDSRSVKEIMQDIPLQHPEVRKEIVHFIRQGLETLNSKA